ncbi:helix-turn-helix transcriptional regulator [Acinetobacter sp. c3-l95]|uniref:S24 family peptidase n=1 Tax=Acinetobacter sp. c3-l95 TaxID=3342804 RepID=UPI0035B93FEE
MKDYRWRITHDKLNDEYAFIPAYDIEASAGHGMFSDGAVQPTRHLAFRKNWLIHKNLKIKDLAIIYTKGDSMVPTIPEKSAILVDMLRNRPLDGRIYVIRIDDRLYVKRTQWLINGGLRLISDNKELYDPIDITKAELENNNIEVVGQVIHVNFDLPD